MKSKLIARPESPESELYSRRQALGGLAALPLLGSVSLARSEQVDQGLVIREKDPENLEYPFGTLSSYITPNDEFYIRSHFKVPAMDIKTWNLSVEGEVSKPTTFTYEDILKLPSKTMVSTLECAGNSRVFLSPTVGGAQWELGAVSNAEWLGVPLSAMLEQVGVKGSAVDVVLVGTDTGMIKPDPKPPTAINFARSLPIAKAVQPEVMLAYRMNGQELPLSHGFPLRVVVPGWYAVASVKWLSRIIVMDRPFNGHFQSVDYAYWERRDGLPTRVMITEMLVKSEIARPAMHEVVRSGENYKVTGAAWTSTGEIAKVEFSDDGGKTWVEARLIGKSAPFTWRLWEHNWKTPNAKGKCTICSRATDSSGRIQPMTRDLDRANYLINHVLPIDVLVR